MMPDLLGADCVPLLSVVLCGDKDNDASIVALQTLRRMLPKNAEVVFSHVGDGGLAKARNAGLEKAKGEFVSFLRVGECYATSRVAEILVLTARLDGANAFGGVGGLSSYVFRREWINSNGLRFYGERNGGELFLRMALFAAGNTRFPARLVISGHALPMASEETVCSCEATQVIEDVNAALRDDLRGVHEAVEGCLGAGREFFRRAIREYLMRGKALKFRDLMEDAETSEANKAKAVALLRDVVNSVDDGDHAIESRLFYPYATSIPDDAYLSVETLRECIAGMDSRFACIGGLPDPSTLRRSARMWDVDGQCDVVVVSNAIGGGLRRIASADQIELVVSRPFMVLLGRPFADAVAAECQGSSSLKSIFAWNALLAARRVYLVSGDGAEGIDFMTEPWSVETALAVHQSLYAHDRLDLAGAFYSLWHKVVLKRGISVEDAGIVLNRTGYAYFASLLLQKDRTNGVSEDLSLWSNAAAGDGVSIPFAACRHESVTDMKGTDSGRVPDISVIMPVYNSERYLIRAIESVRKQTSGNWELICVDDGSVDCSARILDSYAAVDSRIRVYHKPNSGVSDTRNFGLRASNGRYVAFLDADDWYEPTLVEDVMRKCNEQNLDVCFFDYRCRNHETLADIYHFWTFAHVGRHWGDNNGVFASFDLGRWWYYGSMCQMAWSKSFLARHGAEFPRIPLGEDFSVLSRLFPFIERGYVLRKPLYNYQRGSSTSAVSRFKTECGHAFVQKYETLLAIFRDVYLEKTDKVACKKFLGRLLGEIAYDCSVSPAAMEWMRTKGRDGFGLDAIGEAYVLDPVHLLKVNRILAGNSEPTSGDVSETTPRRELELMRQIEGERRKCQVKDLYVVAAQLTSAGDEAIDGWSFFEYLKSVGASARFVVWERHKRAQEFRRAYPEDVIMLSDPSAASYDFLHKCRDALVRAKAVAVEWAVANQSISEWLSGLDGCVYAFLQHGLTYSPPRPVHRRWWTPFNLINFCSERERDMVLPSIGASADVRSVVGGMMRWDMLKDESDPKDRVVLVMFTWRPTFNVKPDLFMKSAYFIGLKALLSAENVERLRRCGLRVVLSLHHSLRSIDRDGLDFGPDVEIVSPQEVSHWIRRASCLITDFSSVSFDFWYMRKPVVYWIPDKFDETLTVPDRDKVGLASRFLATFVNQVRTADEAVGAAVRYAERGFALESEVEGKIRPFFTEGGCFRRRVYEAIEDMTRKETER